MRGSTINASIVIRAALSVVILTGYGIIVFRFISGDVTYSNEVREPMMFLLGTMSAAVGAIVGYWFGSSQGSTEKNAEAAKPAPATEPGKPGAKP